MFNSNGGTATNGNYGYTQFSGNSSAATGTFNANAATVSGGAGGFTAFLDTSNAGTGVFTAEGGIQRVGFRNHTIQRKRQRWLGHIQLKWGTGQRRQRRPDNLLQYLNGLQRHV